MNKRRQSKNRIKFAPSHNFRNDFGRKLIVILGPTASGKTDLAIKLAKKFNGEIISADSRQIYKEMDIGTVKPLFPKWKRINRETIRIIEGVPHYLISVISPDRRFNAAIFRKRVIKIAKDIHKRGKLPFLVGGTGLYIWAIVDNLDFSKTAPNEKLRTRLEKKSEKELFKIYRKLDPRGAKFIDRKNKRRLVRAIEVCKITEESFWTQRQKGNPLFDILQIGISSGHKELRKRINRRTGMMIKTGLEKEAKSLFKKYGDIPPLKTIGYQEWLDYFKGKITRQKVRELIILHTIQYARRQMIWFKRDKRICWIRNQKETECLIRDFLNKK